MATITIRNLPGRVVMRLKKQAQLSDRSMEQHVRVILQAHTEERGSILDQIEESWKDLARPATAREVGEWLSRSLP